MKLATTLRNALLQALADLIDAGASGGTIKIYTGSPPTNPQTAASGTLLATLTFSASSFGSPSSGSMTANTITSDTNVDNSGTAGYCRIADSDGNAVMDLTISEVSGGGDIEFNETDFIAGGTASISSLVATMPES